MKKDSLIYTNPHLRDAVKRAEAIFRSVESSSAFDYVAIECRLTHFA